MQSQEEISQQSLQQSALDSALADHLLELKGLDDSTRAELKNEATAHGEYHPLLEAAHLANAHELEVILEKHGWPGIPLVGERGAAAAFQVAVHAISFPPFQLWCLELLGAAVERGHAPAKHYAILFDRIRFNQRLPQRYGTILDWDESGKLRPWKLESPDGIDALRASVGLEPLGVYAARMRFNAEIEGETPPSNFSAYLEGVERWAHSVGWIESAPAR